MSYGNDKLAPGAKIGIGVGIFVLVALLVWFLFIPPYNKPQFQTIENNQTGFLVPLDQNAADQAHFESASYLKDKKVAAKRVQIHRRWIQTYWLPAWGNYIDTERLITVDRTPIRRDWTDDAATGSTPKDESLSAQTADGTGLKLNFTCTAFIPESDNENPEGAEHFLYYYKGDSLAHVMDTEVRSRVQAVAAEFTAQYPLETLRGTQHKLAEAVGQDVIPFFKKRGIVITKVGLVGGFHYVNKDIQKAIDEAIKAQQLKVTALAQQEKEKVEQNTKLQNQKIDNETMKLKAEGEAAAAIARAQGEAKAKQAAAQVEAESAKIIAGGKATAVKIEADAEAYKLQAIDKFKDLVLGLKGLEIEGTWRQKWGGHVPQTIIQGQTGMLPIFPMDKLITPDKK
jgi:hypothetical protein